MEQRLVALVPEGTKVLHEVPLELALMKLPCGTMPAPRIFAPRVIWTSRGDTVYVLNGPEYRIDAYARGEPVASIRRAMDPIQVTEKLAVAAVESGPGPYRSFMRRCGVTAMQLAAAVGHEEVVSPVLGLAVDPAGRLWVTRGTSGIAPDHTDTFDASGRYLGTIASPALPAAFLSESSFVGISVRETGEVMVSLYELRG